MSTQTDKTLSLDQNETKQSLLDYNHNNIISIQLRLRILLFIQWFVSLVIFGIGIYSVIRGNAANKSSGVQSLTYIIILVIYYTFGLLVTCKYDRVGLLIFAWIGVIVFIAVSIFFGYLGLTIVALNVGFGDGSQAYQASWIIGLIFIVVAIVVIMTLKFAFDLAKLIKEKKYLKV